MAQIYLYRHRDRRIFEVISPSVLAPHDLKDELRAQPGTICNANTLMSPFAECIARRGRRQLGYRNEGRDRNVVPVFSERLKKFKSNANEGKELNISVSREKGGRYI